MKHKIHLKRDENNYMNVYFNKCNSPIVCYIGLCQVVEGYLPDYITIEYSLDRFAGCREIFIKARNGVEMQHHLWGYTLGSCFRIMLPAMEILVIALLKEKYKRPLPDGKKFPLYFKIL